MQTHLLDTVTSVPQQQKAKFDWSNGAKQYETVIFSYFSDEKFLQMEAWMAGKFFFPHFIKTAGVLTMENTFNLHAQVLRLKRLIRHKANG